MERQCRLFNNFFKKQRGNLMNEKMIAWVLILILAGLILFGVMQGVRILS